MYCTRRSSPARVRQRGAAALIVVMLLFFVISLVAAYTSRNLIFEQRTATNQYRSTQAFEAAEAGVDWAIAQLNAGRINTSCQASTTSSDESFRQRHLTINTSTGQLTRRTAIGSTALRAQCVFDGSSGGWRCACPAAGTANTAPAAPTGAGTAVAPAFVVQFTQNALGTRTDLIQLESNSCTRLSADCVNFDIERGGTGDGVASVRVTLALRGALNRLPAAPLTVSGSIGGLPSGVNLTVRNANVATNGVTVHTAASFAPSTGFNLTGLPGTAPASTVVSADSTLLPAAQPGFSAVDLRFARIFGMSPRTYLDQPGLPRLDCSAGCAAADIATVMSRNPGRPVWLSGSSGLVTIDADLGTAAQPALLIVEGDLQLGSGATLHGLVYHRAKPDAPGGVLVPSVWTLNGSSTVRGAVIAEGGLDFVGTSANALLDHDASVLQALRVSVGTFVRVPGSWRDFL